MKKTLFLFSGPAVPFRAIVIGMLLPFPRHMR